MGRRLVRRRFRLICVHRTLVPTGLCEYSNHGSKAMQDIQRTGARRLERILGSSLEINGLWKTRDILRHKNVPQLRLTELSQSSKRLLEWKLMADMKSLFFLERWKTRK